MTPSYFSRCLLAITDPAFQADFAANRLMIRQAIAEGRLRMYCIHVGGAISPRDLCMPAIWLGPCAQKKRRSYASRVMIMKRGAPYVMEVCRNKQLMGWQQGIQARAARAAQG